MSLRSLAQGAGLVTTLTRGAVENHKLTGRHCHVNQIRFCVRSCFTCAMISCTTIEACTIIPAQPLSSAMVGQRENIFIACRLRFAWYVVQIKQHRLHSKNLLENLGGHCS